MRTVLLHSYLFILLSFSLQSQSCFPDGITLTTQFQIDSFKIANPGCTVILGSLVINGADITNLWGLDEIRSVGSLLSVENTNVQNLQGLESIVKAGQISIKKNNALQNLDGLNGLDSVSFILGIYNNLNLTSLEGLGSLKYLFSTFNIIANPKLESLRGLDSLNSIGGLYVADNRQLLHLNGAPALTNVGYLKIEKNDRMEDLSGLEQVTTLSSLRLNKNNSLSSLSGLNSLQTITGTLEVGNNKSLKNLNGLDALQFVQDEMLIVGNNILEDLHALENLTYVGKESEIQYNPLLTSLNGLDNLELSEFYYFRAMGNATLSDCTIRSFCQKGNPEPLFHFYGNTSGCNSISEVENACLVNTKDLSEEDGITLFPNPTTGFIRVDGISFDDAKINITDSRGQHINDYSTSDNTINLANLNSGIYFLHIVTGNQKITKPIIIGL